MTAVVSTTDLRRTFGSVTALNGVTLQFPSAGVIGLLGPNGSGKSTLIRVLLGLIPASTGQASVLGSSIDHPAAYLRRVGALIESPAFLPGLSGHRNLLSLARLRGLSSARVGEVLAMVGLTDRAGDAVKKYSLGMKQRLGIAAALLPDPELLVLDEPTNGLDPAGMVEIRALLLRLGSTGRAVIVSSHVLSEIQAICDHLVVIRAGNLVFSGPTVELLARAASWVSVTAEFDRDSAHLAAALSAEGWQCRDEGPDVRVTADAGDAAEINRVAARAGITLRRLNVEQQSLEQVFLALTASPEPAAAAVA